MQQTVYVRGLRELVRDLGKANKEVRRELNRALRKIGKEVAQEAKSIAASKGLRDSGDLIAGIKPRVRSGTVAVRAEATRRGFNYPVRYEFGDRLRPFLVPALERKRGDVEKGLEQMLDDLLDKTNLN